jgi:hypothetical protein
MLSSIAISASAILATLTMMLSIKSNKELSKESHKLNKVKKTKYIISILESGLNEINNQKDFFNNYDLGYSYSDIIQEKKILFLLDKLVDESNISILNIEDIKVAFEIRQDALDFMHNFEVQFRDITMSHIIIKANKVKINKALDNLMNQIETLNNKLKEELNKC